MIQKNALEWSVFAVSLTLIAGVLGFLVFDATTGDTLVWLVTNVRPAVAYTIRFGVRAPAQTGTVTASVSGQLQRRAIRKTVQFVVPIVVRNEGETGASAVVVEVTAKVKTPPSGNSGEAALPTKTEITLQNVPRLSQREAFVVLEGEPQGEIATRIASFEED